MKSRYLLYIDILGFSDLVRMHPEKVAPLYHLISKMRAHEHGDFQTIVFSDTVIVYNRAIPRRGSDHTYLVMFLCEFAQHLLYLLQGTGIYFRGLVTCGEFEHYRLGKSECFYGKGLIHAYQREKEIKSIGLFIDSFTEAKNIVFDTAPFNEQLRFVFITQNIGRLEEVSVGGFPLDPILLENVVLYNLLYEIAWLSDICAKAKSHPIPEVKKKFETTWQFYRQTYPGVIAALEANSFSPNFICPQHDWNHYEVKPNNLEFPRRPKNSQWGFTLTFQVLNKDVEFRKAVASAVLDALLSRKFTGSCEYFEDISDFGDPPNSTPLYRIALCLRKHSGRELKSYEWWKSYETDVAKAISARTNAIKLTDFSELSEMLAIKEMPLSGGALFEDGEPEAVTLVQDEPNETPFLELVKNKIYWRNA